MKALRAVPPIPEGLKPPQPWPPCPGADSIKNGDEDIASPFKIHGQGGDVLVAPASSCRPGAPPGACIEDCRRAADRQLSAPNHSFFMGERNKAVFAQRRRGAEDSVPAGFGTPRTPKQRTKDHYELRQTSECAALFQHNPNPRSHGLRPGGPTDSSTARERWVSSHDQIKPRQGRQNYLPSLAPPPTHKLPHLLNLDRKVSCHLAGLFWINQLPLVRECPFQPFVFSTNPLPYDQSLLTQ